MDIDFKNKIGVEIGGPSGIFSSLLNIYPLSKSIDGVNFSEKTLWDSRQKGEGMYKYFSNKSGKQFILEATDLHEIEDEKYDFVLSSHNLEHIANPIKAVNEWKRILRPDGLMVIIVPFKELCFDHNREYTSFDHILQDFKNNTGEEDLTHLGDILKKHDLKMDPPAGDLFHFMSRSLDNINNRALHHHVFNIEVMKKIFDYLELEFISSNINGIDIICIAKKKIH